MTIPRRTVVATVVAAVTAIWLQTCLAAQTLESYNVDTNAISVSGISSGAAFATNFHVIFSSSIMGVATFAGVPYSCPLALNSIGCTALPHTVSVGALTSATTSRATLGLVDSPSHITGDKVFIFHGKNDIVINPESSNNVKEYYDFFGADVQTDLDRNVGHGVPTENYGVACGWSISPYLNDCDYYGVFQALSHIYEDLTAPPSGISLDGQLYEYKQREFLTNIWINNFDSNGGYIYVPSACIPKDISCKLHVAFHGCDMGREKIGDVFVREAGYLEIAEANNIIILFPQISSSFWYGNMLGCWDWWGYEGVITYANNLGTQVSTVKAMVDRVTG